MNLFEAVAQANGISVAESQKRLSKVMSSCVENRLLPLYWKTLSSLSNLKIDTSVIEKDLISLNALARFIRTQPGSVDFFDSGTALVLRYLRSSSSGTTLPCTDFCDFVIEFDPILRVYKATGTIYGVVVNTVTDPTILFAEAHAEKLSMVTVIKDYFTRSMLIAERYNGHDLDLYTYKLMTEVRPLGIMTRLDASKLPNVAEFKAAEVPFQCWYAKSTMGLSSIKFSPSSSTPGYSITVPSFKALLKFVDSHVKSQREFSDKCINALRSSVVQS